MDGHGSGRAVACVREDEIAHVDWAFHHSERADVDTAGCAARGHAQVAEPRDQVGVLRRPARRMQDREKLVGPLHIELDRDRGTAKLGVDAPAAVEGEIGAAGRVRPVLLAMQVERRGAYTLIVYRPAARGGPRDAIFIDRACLAQVLWRRRTGSAKPAARED